LLNYKAGASLARLRPDVRYALHDLVHAVPHRHRMAGVEGEEDGRGIKFGEALARIEKHLLILAVIPEEHVEPDAATQGAHPQRRDEMIAGGGRQDGEPLRP